MRALVPLLVLLVAVPAPADVHVDHNVDVDISTYKTFAWEPGTPAKREAAEQFIVATIERELQAKGLQRVESSADVYVSSHVLVDKHTPEQLADKEYWEFWTGVRSVDAYDLGAGTLVVDLRDPDLLEVVWRGVATATVNGPVEKTEKKIGKVVRKLFKKFPPR